MIECAKCGKEAQYAIITPDYKWSAVCEECKSKMKQVPFTDIPTSNVTEKKIEGEL